MKRSVIIGIAVTIFLSIFIYNAFKQVTPSEIENEPDWIPLQTALQQAEIEDKLILIDIYETGCQFCKAMAREVYPSPSVRAALDRSYYPVKVNGHSEKTLTYKGSEMTEQQFAAQLGVTAYPFTIIMDSRGNVIDKRRGYMDIVNLTRFLNSAREAVAES